MLENSKCVTHTLEWVGENIVVKHDISHVCGWIDLLADQGPEVGMGGTAHDAVQVCG